MLGAEADIVGAGIGILRNPGEGPARDATEGRRFKQDVARNWLIVELGGQRPNQWGPGRGRRTKGVRWGCEGCNSWCHPEVKSGRTRCAFCTSGQKKSGYEHTERNPTL